MAFMGCGDVFYGERDYWPDGSYLTTRWLALLYVPLVPLESLRVRELGSAKTEYHGPIVSTSQNYRVYAAAEPHKRQVFFVYGFLTFVAAWMWGLLWTAVNVLHVDKLPKNWDTVVLVVIVLFGVAVAFSIVWAVRRWGHERATGSAPTMEQCRADARTQPRP
jgi:hypothetical protein